MKKLFLGTVALIAFAGSASAADIAVKARPIVAVPACAQFGGFNIGGNAGWKWRNSDWQDRDGFGRISRDVNREGALSDGSATVDTSWTVGLGAGYNFQWNCVVWGVAADWNWTDLNNELSESAHFSGTAPFGRWYHNYNSREKWYATLRTKSGVVVDNLLLYVTGGFAFAKFDRHHAYSSSPDAVGFANLPISETFNSSSTRVGFVVGVGTEYALNQNWSINTEFLYMGFEKSSATYGCSFNTCGTATEFLRPYQYDYKDSQWVTRISLDYRFGGAPVVARY